MLIADAERCMLMACHTAVCNCMSLYSLSGGQQGTSAPGGSVLLFPLCCHDWGLAAALLLLIPIKDNPNSSRVDGVAVERKRHPVEVPEQHCRNEPDTADDVE